MTTNQQRTTHGRSGGSSVGRCRAPFPAGNDAWQDTRPTQPGGFTYDAIDCNRAGRGVPARLASFHRASGFSSPRCACSRGHAPRERQLYQPISLGSGAAVSHCFARFARGDLSWRLAVPVRRAADIQLSRSSPFSGARTFGQHISCQGSDAAPHVQRLSKSVGFNTDRHKREALEACSLNRGMRLSR